MARSLFFLMFFISDGRKGDIGTDTVVPGIYGRRGEFIDIFRLSKSRAIKVKVLINVTRDEKVAAQPLWSRHGRD